MSERIYRDPVHNIIRLRTATDEGRLMVRLIDSFEFRRLRRIEQLGLALDASRVVCNLSVARECSVV